MGDSREDGTQVTEVLHDFFYLACTMTHLAWTGELLERNGQYYARAESWVHGSTPLPSEFPIGFRSTAGLPPPPVLKGQLAVLRFEHGEWTHLATVFASEAPDMIALASKINVSGSLVQVSMEGVKGVPVTLIVEAGGREQRRIVTSAGRAEFFGLPPGDYSVKAEAQGYRQVREAPMKVGRCGEARAVLERYGWREWAAEEFAPVISLAKASWMLASEYIR